MTTSLFEFDPDEPFFDSLGKSYTGYGGSKPRKPFPKHCPDEERIRILTEWARLALSNRCIVDVDLGGRNPPDKLGSIELGKGTILDSVKRATSRILHVKAQFAFHFAKLYDFYHDLTVHEFALCEDAKSSLDCAMKALAYIEMIVSSIEREEDRPRWIEKREAVFLHSIFNNYYG